MNSSRSADWHEDLRASRDLSDWEKQHFGFVLAWFPSWRLCEQLPAGREAAVRFWREMVQCKPRKEWQTGGWAQGLAWYLRWLEMCAAEGRQVGACTGR